MADLSVVLSGDLRSLACRNADMHPMSIYGETGVEAYRTKEICSLLRNSDATLLMGNAMMTSSDGELFAEAMAGEQPLVRDEGGKRWSFVSDRVPAAVCDEVLASHHPVGSSASEHLFCMLLDTLRLNGGASPDVIARQLSLKALRVAHHAAHAFLLTDGMRVFGFSSAPLYWRLEAEAQSWILTVTNTQPDESADWTCTFPGSLTMWEASEVVAQVRAGNGEPVAVAGAEGECVDWNSG